MVSYNIIEFEKVNNKLIEFEKVNNKLIDQLYKLNEENQELHNLLYNNKNSGADEVEQYAGKKKKKI